MDLHKILDSIYIIPAILDHLDNPTETTTKLLLSAGIGPKQIEECREVRELLLYHYKVIVTGYSPNYDQLRDGLVQYFEAHLSDMFKKLGIIEKEWRVLDYGCGNGQVSTQFLKDNPDSYALRVDRDSVNITNFKRIDFETQPYWYKPYTNTFDLVILSEVLHCKDHNGQLYLIDSSIQLLRDKGTLIVVENKDYCMEYRISKIKQNNFKVLNEWHVRELTQGSNLALLNMITINRHNIYEFQKVR